MVNTLLHLAENRNPVPIIHTLGRMVESRWAMRIRLLMVARMARSTSP
jgi:hypothetical protein